MKRVVIAALAALLAFPLGVGSAIADDYEEEPPPQVYQADEAGEAYHGDEVYQIDAVYQAEETYQADDAYQVNDPYSGAADIDLYSFIWGLYSSVRGQWDFSSAALGAVAMPGPQAVSDLWLELTGQDDKNGKGKGAAPTAAGPTVAVPSGYRLYPKPGFGLALPNDWTEIDLIDRSRSPRQIVAALPPLSPDPIVDQRFKERLADRIAGLRQRDFSFFGFAFEVDGIDSDVTLLRRSIPPGATLDEITDVWIAILEEDPNVVGPLSRESVTIPAGPARLIGYGTQAGTVEDRAIVVPTIDLLVQRTTGTADELYVLTFSTVVEPDEPEYDPTIETIVQIIRTFHFR